jgi:outer membrane protein OmpA-like peptidoglycan-associated protein
MTWIFQHQERGRYMGSIARLALLLLLIVLAGGCAKRTLVALVPDPEGKTGSITLGNEAGSVSINEPYQATFIDNAKEPPTAPTNLGKDALDKIFAEALSIQPKRPIHFLLYFEKETTLTADSAKLLPEIITAIRERNSTDISVIGHTDTVGSSEYNTLLSRSRANAVKDLLISQGAESKDIRTTSHGKGNLLIPTADNVNEPKNRRVEVIVR